MTKRQEYLAHDMSEEQIEYCKSEAEKLERTDPWTAEDTARHADYAGYGCWLDLVLDHVRHEIEWQYGQYCAQMEE